MTPNRLTAQLDGATVYLYTFIQGAYEDRRHFLCAHLEQLSNVEVFDRLQAVIPLLPEAIDEQDCSKNPDLFERALDLADFIVLDEMIPHVRLRAAHPPVTSRGRLEALIGLARKLDR